MVRRASTLDDLNGIIHRLYEAAVQPELWQTALKTVGEGLGGCALGLTLHTQTDSPRRLALSGFDPDCMEVMFRSYPDSRTNPMVAAMSGLPSAVPTVRQAVITDADYFGSGLYNEVFRQQGLAHAAVACAFRSEDHFVPLGIFRREGQDFGEHEHDLLKLLLPHLRRALQIHFRVSSLNARQEAADSTLDRLAFGLIYIGNAGRVSKLNRQADAIIAEDDGLGIQGGGLYASSAAENRDLQALIRSALGSSHRAGFSSGGAIAISRPSMKQPLSILIVPLPVTKPDSDLYQSGAVAFVADPTRRISPSEETIMQLLGLTYTETKVACMLVAGLTIDEIGQGLGTKPNTIRTQVKTIFRKTDTKRQSDLVRVVLNSVAALHGQDQSASRCRRR